MAPALVLALQLNLWWSPSPRSQRNGIKMELSDSGTKTSQVGGSEGQDGSLFPLPMKALADEKGRGLIRQVHLPP